MPLIVLAPEVSDTEAPKEKPDDRDEEEEHWAQGCDPSVYVNVRGEHYRMQGGRVSNPGRKYNSVFTLVRAR